MTRVTLSSGTNLAKPWFDYWSDAPQLPPGIDGKANSLCAFPMDAFTGTPFTGVKLYNGPNYTGDCLVITQGGSVDDLSRSPWGNLANWIRSLKVSSAGLATQAEIDKFINETDFKDKITLIEAMPGEAPSMIAPQVNINGSDPQLTELQLLVAQSAKGQTQQLMDKISSLMRPFAEFMPSSEPQGGSGPRGGGATISAPGQKVNLCQSSACNTLNVNVSGQATVRIEMWYLFAQLPAGSWQVGGPATVPIPLYNNTFNTPTQCGETCYIYAIGLSGSFPVYVSAN
jgi:hypothetical protein